MKSSLKRVITALLAAVLLATAPCVPAFGAQEYYVNDGENLSLIHISEPTRP